MGTELQYIQAHFLGFAFGYVLLFPLLVYLCKIGIEWLNKWWVKRSIERYKAEKWQQQAIANDIAYSEATGDTERVKNLKRINQCTE